MRVGRVTIPMLLLFSLPLAAGGPSGTTPKDGSSRTLIVGIEGTPLPQKQLRLVLKPGPVATQAIRVYSEPSRTHLLLLVDSRFSETPEGSAWVRGKKAETAPSAFVKTTLPDSEPMVQIPGRPEGDDSIVVYVNGDWPGGVAGDRLVADGRVGNGKFSVSTWLTGQAGSPDTWYEHCCSGAGCSEMCIGCGTARFTCCLNSPPGCCAIYCGFRNCCE